MEAGDAERRRLERNLHDGAQQRLVSISLALRLAMSRIDTDPDGANEILAGAGQELSAALEELRELARGLHPAVLADSGRTTRRWDCELSNPCLPPRSAFSDGRRASDGGRTGTTAPEPRPVSEPRLT